MAIVNAEKNLYLGGCSQIQVLKFLSIFENISYVALEGWGEWDFPPHQLLHMGLQDGWRV